MTVVSCRFASAVGQEDDGSQDENAAGEAEEEEDPDDEDEDRVRTDGEYLYPCVRVDDMMAWDQPSLADHFHRILPA